MTSLKSSPNADTWELVKDLVDACLDVPAARRARYLADHCETALRAEVMSLVKAYEESDFFLDNPSAIAADVAAVVSADEQDRKQIGPYKLMQEVGRGGMGTVYRAFRDDDAFQIVVALKVVSRGMDSDAVLKRFRTERQILASLDHPYIARILDGGSTATGLPYFVMEYVDGRPLTRYCDEERLSISERLVLFRKVCEAVAYAHQHLVVHRDLKPGNILVAADGTPKLLDFGIARILGGSPFQETETISGTLQMATPAYASPEQISGELTEVASDVYSLGVILYELLTGHPPYRLGAGNAQSVAQVIREREPTRPSAVVGMTEPSGNPAAISQKRRSTVDALRRRLRGDLDNIVAMALRKESQRRYGSVEQLSEDVRRHLDGLPVVARKDTVWYRASKFVKRHRVGLAATVVVATALCATTTMAFLKAHQLSNRISQDHKLGSLFLVDIHDAIARLPGSTPAREALLGQSLKYLNELAHHAHDDVAINKALALAHERFAELQSGAVAGGLGQASAAFKTYGRAQEIREELAAAHPQDRATQLQLAESYLLAAVITGRAGGADKRIEYDRKALSILEKLTAQDGTNRSYRAALARAHTGIAYGLSQYDEWRPGREHLLKALDLRKSLLKEAPGDGPARRAVALSYYRLGVNYAQSGLSAEAMPYLNEALALQTVLVEGDLQNRPLRSDVASTRHFLAVCLGRMNRPADSLPHLDAAIALRESMLAEDNRDARRRSLLAGNYAEQSTALLRVNQQRSALRAAERAVELQNAVLALDPQAVPARVSAADFHARAGAAYTALRHHSQAIAMYDRSVELYDKLQAEGHLRSNSTVEEAENARLARARIRTALTK